MIAAMSLLWCTLSASGVARAEAPGPEEIARWLDAVVVVTTGPSLCAGVILDDAGQVATAYHCVASGRRPRLATRDGLEVEARVTATDPRADLALLDAPELAGRPGLPLREGAPSPGEPIWALGHPSGSEAEGGGLFEGLLRWSVSRGVVSAVGPRLIQVDAPMNPGNSGGPVVDAEGRVVGIASRKLRGDGLGFLAPAVDLAALQADPSLRRVPVTLAVGLSGTLPASPALASGLGGYAELAARDLLILRLDGAASPDIRWTTLATGAASWPAAQASLSMRARVGRAAWSTSLDLGGGVLLLANREAALAEDALRLRTRDPVPAPMAALRLGFGGAAVRWVVAAPPEAPAVLMVALDVDWPGVVKVF